MDKQKVLAALKSLRDNRPCRYSGICSNLEEALYIAAEKAGEDPGSFRLVEDWLSEQFVQWPKFSGCTSYPVPSPNDPYESAAHAYDSASWEEMWSGPYGAGPYGQLRLELLEFLINQLENEMGLNAQEHAPVNPNAPSKQYKPVHGGYPG